MKAPLDHASALWQKAGNDLVAARATLATEQALDTVCFHAQQTVEKSLKALLALHDVEYPWWHDMAELYELARPVVAGLAPYKEKILSMTPFAVEIRYDAEFSPSFLVANEAVRLASEIHALIGELIRAKGNALERLPAAPP
ncbi:MAG: HEPN domain-containing protein [Chloroflexi bacterium]|nr:HEPN domain-containing protein [Chloroflexota bacterium]